MDLCIPSLKIPLNLLSITLTLTGCKKDPHRGNKTQRTPTDGGIRFVCDAQKETRRRNLNGLHLLCPLLTNTEFWIDGQDLPEFKIIQIPRLKEKNQ